MGVTYCVISLQYKKGQHLAKGLLHAAVPTPTSLESTLILNSVASSRNAWKKIVLKI